MDKHKKEDMQLEQQLDEIEVKRKKEKEALVRNKVLLDQNQAIFDRLDNNKWIKTGVIRVKQIKSIASGKKKLRDVTDKKQLQRKSKQKIKKLKRSLYEHGFYQEVIPELQKISEKSTNPYDRKNALLELIVWYANQYNKQAAEQAIHYIAELKKFTLSDEWLRKVVILEAEMLMQIDKQTKAMELLTVTSERTIHPDLYFALASTEIELENKAKWMNKVFDMYQLTPISFTDHPSTTPYDRVRVKQSSPHASTANKVTVIIPVYNAEKTISTALKAMTNQTWRNIEIIVVDDCSTDETIAVVEKYKADDERIKLLQNNSNAGAYIARNKALQMATGDFITVNDADDWSHPQKIEIQVNHLLDNEEVIANTSQQARVTEDFHFHRRGKPGEYLFSNMSSLLFRRFPVIEQIGYWDSVRFAADGEFKKRLIKVFGKEAVVDLKTGPCSFQRQSSSSLTANSVFGYPGFFMGVRKEYLDAYTQYHQYHRNLYYPFPMKERPFAVPEPMWPEREVSLSKDRRHFDVIIASEFRLLGGTNMSNIEEMKAQKELGLKTGLIQMYRPDLHSVQQINPKVREHIDGNKIQMLNYGERVSCNVLIVRHPPVLQAWQQYLPNVETKSVKVIVNQPPKRDYTKEEASLYDIKTCAKRVKEYFGKKAIWYPIGPSVREALEQYHQEELQDIILSSDDWVNIINVVEWKRTERPQDNTSIKIGRHSRSQYVKWPNDKEELLKIYPTSKDYQIHVLGGAQVPEKLLGTLPSNWKVYQFGEIEPRDFLKEIDVFVYYTHPGWIEAFGRVIFEAMAVGVPVIIPPSYRNLFKDAAIYAEPDEVLTKVHELMQNPEQYQAQVDRALQFVESYFGYSMHANRLEPHLLPSIKEVGDRYSITRE